MKFQDHDHTQSPGNHLLNIITGFSSENTAVDVITLSHGNPLLSIITGFSSENTIVDVITRSCGNLFLNIITGFSSESITVKSLNNLPDMWKPLPSRLALWV